MRTFIIIPIILVILAIGGWIANIVKIIGSLDDPTVTPMLIARIIGAFVAPIGAILGFF